MIYVSGSPIPGSRGGGWFPGFRGQVPRFPVAGSWRPVPRFTGAGFPDPGGRFPGYRAPVPWLPGAGFPRGPGAKSVSFLNIGKDYSVLHHGSRIEEHLMNQMPSKSISHLGKTIDIRSRPKIPGTGINGASKMASDLMTPWRDGVRINKSSGLLSANKTTWIGGVSSSNMRTTVLLLFDVNAM